MAIDVLRLLAKTPQELAGSDLGAGPTNWLANSAIETLTIVGRSSASNAKFDPVMLKELDKLSHVQIDIRDLAGNDEGDGHKTLDALAQIDGHGANQGSSPRRIIFRFGLAVEAVEGTEQVTTVRFSTASGGETIPCSSVITAIGFEPAGPFSQGDLPVGAADGKAGQLAPGLYAAGWFRHGPRGTIPQHRTDAQAQAKAILAELTPDPDKAGRSVLNDIEQSVSYDDWLKIDRAETAAVPEGRCRTKISSTDEMLRIAMQKEATQ